MMCCSWFIFLLEIWGETKYDLGLGLFFFFLRGRTASRLFPPQFWSALWDILARNESLFGLSTLQQNQWILFLILKKSLKKSLNDTYSKTDSRPAVHIDWMLTSWHRSWFKEALWQLGIVLHKCHSPVDVVNCFKHYGNQHDLSFP